MKKLIISGFAAACLAVAASSMAHAEEVTVRVNHSDLDLTRKADVAKLRSRVRVAVKDACGETSTVTYLGSATKCLSDAMAQADSQIARHRSLALAMASSDRN